MMSDPMAEEREVAYLYDTGPETDGRRCSRHVHRGPWPDCVDERVEIRARIRRLHAIHEQLRVPDDPAVEAALARLPRDERVPPIGPPGITNVFTTPQTMRAWWPDEEYIAYRGALLRCLAAARHDPGVSLLAHETSLRQYCAAHGLPDPEPALTAEVQFRSLVMALDWAWERAVEEAAGQHEHRLAPARASELRSFLLRFRLTT